MLVQSKRNKHAALKLMRKLLKKYAFAPERLVTDDLRSYAPAARDLGIEHLHERGRWRNSRAAPRRDSSQPTPPCTTLSTSNAISRQLNHIACSAPRDDHVARGRRGRMKLRAPYSPLALVTCQRDDAIGSVARPV